MYTLFIVVGNRRQCLLFVFIYCVQQKLPSLSLVRISFFKCEKVCVRAHLRFGNRVSGAGCKLNREGRRASCSDKSCELGRTLHHWDGRTLFDKFQVSPVNFNDNVCLVWIM